MTEFLAHTVFIFSVSYTGSVRTRVAATSQTVSILEVIAVSTGRAIVVEAAARAFVRTPVQDIEIEIVVYAGNQGCVGVEG